MKHKDNYFTYRLFKKKKKNSTTQRLYSKHDLENNTTIDLICHAYKGHQCRRQGSEIE